MKQRVKPVVSVAIDADVLEQLDAYARGRNVSRSSAVNTLLSQCFAKPRKEPRGRADQRGQLVPRQTPQKEI